SWHSNCEEALARLAARLHAGADLQACAECRDVKRGSGVSVGVGRRICGIERGRSLHDLKRYRASANGRTVGENAGGQRHIEGCALSAVNGVTRVEACPL